MTLTEKIQKYIELQKQKTELEEDINQWKEDIIEQMDAEGVNKVEVNDSTAQLSSKTTIKYTDETELIRYLKANGYGRYVVEKVDSTPFNKELKKGGALTESVSHLFSQAESKVLTIK